MIIWICVWRTWRVLIPLPSQWQCDALPIELQVLNLVHETWFEHVTCCSSGSHSTNWVTRALFLVVLGELESPTHGIWIHCSTNWAKVPCLEAADRFERSHKRLWASLSTRLKIHRDKIWKVKTESNCRWQSQILLCYHYTTHQLLVFDLLNYNNSSTVSSSSLKKRIATLRQIGLYGMTWTFDPCVPNTMLYQPELHRVKMVVETGNDPVTFALSRHCSTNWATRREEDNGIEPLPGLTDSTDFKSASTPCRYLPKILW